MDCALCVPHRLLFEIRQQNGWSMQGIMRVLQANIVAKGDLLELLKGGGKLPKSDMSPQLALLI